MLLKQIVVYQHPMKFLSRLDEKSCLSEHQNHLPRHYLVLCSLSPGDGAVSTEHKPRCDESRSSPGVAVATPSNSEWESLMIQEYGTESKEESSRQNQPHLEIP